MGEPQPWSLAELEVKWTGEVVLLTRRDNPIFAALKFGFSWFVPVMGRFEKLFGEVLLAAFFIQMFALITPMFTQVVIDKVLVAVDLPVDEHVTSANPSIADFAFAITRLRDTGTPERFNDVLNNAYAELADDTTPTSWHDSAYRLAKAIIQAEQTTPSETAAAPVSVINRLVAVVQAQRRRCWCRFRQNRR